MRGSAAARFLFARPLPEKSPAGAFSSHTRQGEVHEVQNADAALFLRLSCDQGELTVKGPISQEDLEVRDGLRAADAGYGL